MDDWRWKNDAKARKVARRKTRLIGRDVTIEYLSGWYELFNQMKFKEHYFHENNRPKAAKYIEKILSPGSGIILGHHKRISHHGRML